jgi:kynureninase
MKLPVTKDNFIIPSNVTYLAGMSLGCLPRKTIQIINEELDVWGSQGVEGHGREHKYGRSWFHEFEHLCITMLVPLLGASPDELAIMGELSANINMLFLQFFRPTKEKYKIIMEDMPFPSDKFLVEGHVARLNLPSDAIIYVRPEDNSGIIMNDQFVELLKNDSSIAMVFLGAVNYYSGQFYDIERISAAARATGTMIALDLAHAIGNVPLKLSKWDIDFASWCSYKYLNSGPGSIAGIYVNQRHLSDPPVFRGWWGCKERFSSEYCAVNGAARFEMSNPSILSMSALYGSLCLFAECDINDIRRKSFELCSIFRENVSNLIDCNKLIIITPPDYDSSGAQLSLLFPGNCARNISEKLRSVGFVTDMRLDTIRVAFVALYNTIEDVLYFSKCLNDFL